MSEAGLDTIWEPQRLQPVSSCNSCIDTLDDLDWIAATTLRVGRWALGVRSSSIEMDAALRRVLRAHVVDVEAPANFSALMADGDARTFNFLYRVSDPLVRTRDPGRVMRTLVAHLSEFAEPTAPTMRLHATGLLADGRAIIAPDLLRAEIAAIETRLNVAGIQVIDAPTLQLEPGTANVIVPEPALTVDRDALAEFEREHQALGRETRQRPRRGREPRARELPPVLPGRYPIMAWAFVTAADRVGPVSRAQAIAAAAQQVANAEAFGAQPTLDAVVAAVANVSVSGLWWHESGELAGQLRTIIEHAA